MCHYYQSHVGLHLASLREGVYLCLWVVKRPFLDGSRNNCKIGSSCVLIILSVVPSHDGVMRSWQHPKVQAHKHKGIYYVCPI